MDGRGNVIAEFTNGRSAPIAKIALYHFMNDQGLEKVSSTLFSASANSGDAIFYTDANGNPILGSAIYSNRLEGSNVSMATALTELIVMQKAFDASAKSITTSDQMIQNAINMKA
jgi:flagellar hook protein FlgE